MNQSAAMVLQYYVRQQNISTEHKYGVPLTVF